MNKILILSLSLGLCLIYFSGFLSASQIVLFNTTGKTVEFSFTFFHDETKKKMVISGFKLAPREKTRFPQTKDLHLAHPLKLKVHWKGNTDSSISTTFDQKDTSLHDIKLIQKDGKLEFATDFS